MSNSQQFTEILEAQKITVQKISELTGVSILALEYMIQQDLLPKTHVAQKIAKILDMPVHAVWPQLGNKKE